MKIGDISLNVPAIADISEQSFYNLVKGSIDIDKKEAWELFSKEAEPFKKKVEAKQKPFKFTEESKE
jgi:hypothetical protein